MPCCATPEEPMSSSHHAILALGKDKVAQLLAQQLVLSPPSIFTPNRSSRSSGLPRRR